ncbi:hypothetical protein Mapa_009256 [Marchantia paleacea]|nr:hypothetical protein Mapa_009256 [Marchantia paleacea]
MYAMAAKAHGSFSKLLSVNSRFLSSWDKGKNVAVKVPVQTNLASKDGLVVFSGEAASQRQASSHSIQAAASSPQLPVHQKEKIQVPDITPPYEDRGLYPLTAELNEETHNWLVGLNVHTELGPEGWKKFTAGKLPYLAGQVYLDVERKDFLWGSKYLTWITFLDDFLDRPEICSDMNKTVSVILETHKVIMWFCSEDPHLLRNLEMVFDCVPADQRDDVVNSFSESLAYARTSSRSGLLSLELQPITSALRELWIEYCDRLPYDCIVRMARYIQNILLAFVGETKSRVSEVYPTTLADYTHFRTLSVGVQGLIGLTDLFIDSRQWPQIPNDVFYGTNMHGLVDASCDVVAWTNDMYSFRKEVEMRGDHLNLIFVISQEFGCSYAEAMNRAKEMIQCRINDFETTAANLKVEAPYQNAVAEYTRIGRLWMMGSFLWHHKSQRFHEEDKYLN